MSNDKAYTLIELLVVISIISIMSVMGFISFKGFSEDQATKKAVGQVQSLLRLAQSNATSSTLCNGQAATSWSLKFINPTTMELHCDRAEDIKIREYTLENARVESTQNTIPFTLTYLVGSGALSISPCDTACSNATSITITIKNTLNNETKDLKLSKGGAVDVQ